MIVSANLAASYKEPSSKLEPPPGLTHPSHHADKSSSSQVSVFVPEMTVNDAVVFVCGEVVGSICFLPFNFPISQCVDVQCILTCPNPFGKKGVWISEVVADMSITYLGYTRCCMYLISKPFLFINWLKMHISGLVLCEQFTVPLRNGTVLLLYLLIRHLDHNV